MKPLFSALFAALVGASLAYAEQPGPFQKTIDHPTDFQSFDDLLAYAEHPRLFQKTADHPKDFESLDDLKWWARSSSFGSGGCASYRLGSREVHVVNRGFTSGVPTTELSFWVQQPRTSRLTCVLFQPVRGVEVRCKLQDQILVIEQYDSDKRGWFVALTLTEYLLRP